VVVRAKDVTLGARTRIEINFKTRAPRHHSIPFFDSAISYDGTYDTETGIFTARMVSRNFSCQRSRRVPPANRTPYLRTNLVRTLVP